MVTAFSLLSSNSSQKKQSYAERKEEQKKIKKIQRAVEECEKHIADMEARIAELDELFMQPEKASDMVLVTEYTSTKQKLDEENDKWLELSEQLEEAKSNLE